MEYSSCFLSAYKCISVEKKIEETKDAYYDVLEQIVGEDIQDEFDQDDMREFVQTGPDDYVVSGAVTLFDLADYLPDLDLECPGVTTFGGYITHEQGHIPEEGEEVQIGRYLARVTGTDGRRVTQVRLKKVCKENEDGDI